MLLTAMESVTVTVHFADAFPTVAVITTVPPEMAVTSPAFTVATLVSELLQIISASEISVFPVYATFKLALFPVKSSRVL